MAPAPEDEDEDDYLTMALPSLSTPRSNKNESLTQKTKRLAREREEKAHPKSKAELAIEAKRKREEGLKRNILADRYGEDAENGAKSKGAAIMAKLGYKPGTALGKPTTATPSAGDTTDTRLLEPIGISEREGRGGIGADAERKRKIREEFAEREEGFKKIKENTEGYRERQAKEREEARMEGLLRGAMGVSERLDEEDEAEGAGRDVAGETVKRPMKQTKRLRDIPVLYRSLVKHRLLTSRDKRMRHDLQQSLSSRTDYLDPEEEREDRIALGKETEEEDGEMDLEDEELNEFEALEVGVRLDKVVAYLRERWKYCFWCKYRYPDEAMEECPGVREEDHD